MGNLVRKRAQLLFNTVDATSLVYDSGAVKTLAIKEYNIIGNSGVTLKKFKKSKTFVGLLEKAIVTPDFGYPLDTREYEWFLDLKGKTNLGQGRVDQLFLMNKTYQGYTGALLAANAGKIADADKIKLIDSMVLSINSDKWAPAKASRVGLQLFLTAKTADTRFDTALQAIYGTVVYSATQFSSAIGATNGDATVTIAGAGFTVNALAGQYVYVKSGTDIGTVKKILSNTATVITVDGVYAGTEVALDVEVVGGRGSYPRLTLADIQKIFPILPSNAGTGGERYPAGSADWSKYYFKVDHSGAQAAYALDGANHLDTYIEEFEIYVPTAVAEAAANWDTKILAFLTAVTYVDPNGDTTPWGLTNA
jgi:hypothetical protein